MGFESYPKNIQKRNQKTIIKTSNMKHEPETMTATGLAVWVLIMAFGLVWMFLHSDEIAKRDQQRLDNIIKTYKLH